LPQSEEKAAAEEEKETETHVCGGKETTICT